MAKRHSSSVLIYTRVHVFAINISIMTIMSLVFWINHKTLKTGTVNDICVLHIKIRELQIWLIPRDHFVSRFLLPWQSIRVSLNCFQTDNINNIQTADDDATW